MPCQLEICPNPPGHPSAKAGDIVQVYKSGTLSGKIRENIILNVGCFDPSEMIEIATSLEPEYIETHSSKKGLLKLEVENNIPEDEETWTIIKDKPKFRANISGIFKEDGDINTGYIQLIETGSKQAVLSLLQDIGQPCVYNQLDELRISK